MERRKEIKRTWREGRAVTNDRQGEPVLNRSGDCDGEKRGIYQSKADKNVKTLIGEMICDFFYMVKYSSKLVYLRAGY